MRQFWIIALAALVTLGVSADAEAGKKKKKNKGGDTTTEEAADKDSDGIQILDTGLEDVDSFFAAAKAPIGTLTSTRQGIDKLQLDLNTALGLAEGTPLADAIADLKSKAGDSLTVAMDGTMPKVTASDAAPENVTTAVDALNSGVDEIGKLVGGLAQLPAQIAELIQEGQKFSDVNTLKGMASNPMLAAKAVPKVGKNLKALTKIKGEAEALLQSVDGLKQSLTSIGA